MLKSLWQITGAEAGVKKNQLEREQRVKTTPWHEQEEAIIAAIQQYENETVTRDIFAAKPKKKITDSTHHIPLLYGHLLSIEQQDLATMSFAYHQLANFCESVGMHHASFKYYQHSRETAEAFTFAGQQGGKQSVETTLANSSNLAVLPNTLNGPPQSWMKRVQSRDRLQASSVKNLIESRQQGVQSELSSGSSSDSVAIGPLKSFVAVKRIQSFCTIS